MAFWNPLFSSYITVTILHSLFFMALVPCYEANYEIHREDYFEGDSCGNFPMNHKIYQTFALTCSIFGTVILLLGLSLFGVFRRNNNTDHKPRDIEKDEQEKENLLESNTSHQKNLEKSQQEKEHLHISEHHQTCLDTVQNDLEVTSSSFEGPYGKPEKGEQEKEDILESKTSHQKNLEENQQKKEHLQTVEHLQTRLDILQKNFEKSQQEKDILQKDLGKRKDQFKLAWKNAPLYPDWRKEEFYTVNVILDELTAHPNLLLSENGTQVTWREKYQDLTDSIKRFDSLQAVLGQQLTVTEKRIFWEIEVDGACSWDLGVCRDDVTRKGRVTISPKNGFWAIRLYDGEYWAITSPETQLFLNEKPRIVGIFLDYEDGEISFYDMNNNSHIYSFPQTSFSGSLRPFLRLWDSMSGTLKTVKDD